MKNFSAEMIEKAKATKSAEELLEVAKAAGIKMTANEAATYFAQLNPKSGELGDDDLDAVSGGSICRENPAANKLVLVTSGQTCPCCGSNRGVYTVLEDSAPHIFCENNCKHYIACDDGSCTYEIIG